MVRFATEPQGSVAALPRSASILIEVPTSMVDTLRDLISVAGQLKGACTRILEPNSDSLTSIQIQASRDALVRELKDEGLSFDVSRDRDAYTGNPDYSKILFKWLAPTRVRGSGIIADVRTLGDFPICLSVGDHVSVYFEPRNLGKVIERREINNREFAQLRKGSSYEFQGVICYCIYYFRQGPNSLFEFRVESRGNTSTNESSFAGFFRSLFG
jgi:hypothetical protein